MGFLIIRPGRIVHVTKHGLAELLAQEHNRKFKIYSIGVEREEEAHLVHVNFALSCLHCERNLDIHIMLSIYDTLLNGVYQNSEQSIFMYDKMLVVDEKIWYNTGLCLSLDLDRYKTPDNDSPKQETNPNILFRMRVGRK
jgi:hypothetical protein